MHVWSVLTGLWVLNIDVVVAAMVVMMKRFMIRGGENLPNWNFFHSFESWSCYYSVLLIN